MPVVPKKRFSRFLTKRRHVLQYMDHYRFLFKPRREHFERRRYQEIMYNERYSPPPFRHPGFWPGTFGHPRIQAIQALVGDGQDGGGGGAPAPEAAAPPGKPGEE